VGEEKTNIGAGVSIRDYAHDYDDVMDVCAPVCEALREDGLRRLRTYFKRRSSAP